MLATTAVLAVLAVGLVVTLRARGGESGTGEPGDGWTAPSAGFSNQVVTDGSTVCGTNFDGLLYCLDAATGVEQFTEQLGDGPIPISIVNETLLVGNQVRGQDERTLLAYSLDGTQLWTAPLTDGLPDVRGTPVVDGIVAIRNGFTPSELVGLDIATGQERWRISTAAPGQDPEDPGIASLVFTDGARFYVTHQTHPGGPDRAGYVVAIDPATGSELWRSNADPTGQQGGLTAIHSAAAFDDGAAVAFAIGGLGTPSRLVVFDTATGQLRWELTLEAPSRLAHLAGVTIAVNGTRVHGYDRDGTELWNAEAPASTEIRNSNIIESHVFVEDSVLYLFVGQLFRVDPQSGEIEIVVEETSEDAVVSDQHIVIVSSYQIEGRPLGG